MKCPICSATSEQTFYMLCKHPQKPEQQVAIEADACEQCFDAISRKERILPYFYGPGVGLILVSAMIAWRTKRTLIARFSGDQVGVDQSAIMFQDWAIILLSVMPVLGALLLVLGGIVSWRIGNTMLRDSPLKRFAARASKEHLDLFAPAMTLVTTVSKSVPTIKYEPSEQSEPQVSS